MVSWSERPVLRLDTKEEETDVIENFSKSKILE